MGIFYSTCLYLVATSTINQSLDLDDMKDEFLGLIHLQINTNTERLLFTLGKLTCTDRSPQYM